MKSIHGTPMTDSFARKERDSMGYTIGLPSLKLNNCGTKSKHCGSLKGVSEEALEERLGKDVDIDRGRADQNILLQGFRTARELQEYSAKHIEEINAWRAEHGERSCDRRKLKENTVVMCATIIKPPAEMMAGLTFEQQMQFLKDSYEILKQFVGEDNIKSAIIHNDELVPHLHVFWEPVTSDGRLCAKEMHNLKFFGKLNREMPELLRQKGWTMVDDCQCYDKAEHDKIREELGEKGYREWLEEQKKSKGQNSVQFKYQAEKEKNAILEECEALKEQVKDLETQQDYLLNRNDELVTENETLTNKLEALTEQLSKTEGQTAEALKHLEALLDVTKLPPRPEERPQLPKPREPKDPRTVSGWTKEEYKDYKKELSEWQKECKAIDKQNAEIDVQNAAIRQQQTEWDKNMSTVLGAKELLATLRTKEIRTDEALRKANQMTAAAEQIKQNAEREQAEVARAKKALAYREMELGAEAQLRAELMLHDEGYLTEDFIKQEMSKAQNRQNAGQSKGVDRKQVGR